MPERSITSNAQVRQALDRIEVGPKGTLNWKWEWQVEEVTYLSNSTTRRGWAIKLSFERHDTGTGLLGRGTGREWIVWSGITETGLLKTAWCAFQAIITHEAMHAFTVDGKALFDPHASVDELLSVSEISKPDAYGMWKVPAAPLRDPRCGCAGLTHLFGCPPREAA